MVSALLELTFLGTRGEIDLSTKLHRRHSALLVRHGKVRLLIDCGTDWLHRVHALRATAILVTHAHPDHAWGLAQGAPAPVYATAATQRLLSHYPIADRRIVVPRKRFSIADMRIEAFPVVHSLRAPAVGYRISAGSVSFFYVPDVVAIPARSEALADIALYIGDGSTLKRPLVRRRGKVLFGHTPMSTQLGWCRKEGVSRAIFTHCGSEIVGANPRAMNKALQQLATEHCVSAQLAHDGQRIRLK